MTLWKEIFVTSKFKGIIVGHYLGPVHNHFAGPFVGADPGLPLWGANPLERAINLYFVDKKFQTLLCAWWRGGGGVGGWSTGKVLLGSTTILGWTWFSGLHNPLLLNVLLHRYNEKIYMFLWFWMLFVAIITLISICTWLARACMRIDRIRWVFTWRQRLFVGLSFDWGHWYPCSGLITTIGLGFKIRVNILTFMLP